MIIWCLLLSKKDQIYDVLKAEDLTTRQISKKLNCSTGTISSYISKLKKEGKISVVGKEGRSNIYSVVSETQKIDKSVPTKEAYNLVDNPKFIDALMFSFISSSSRASFSKIQDFFASLGILDKNLLFALLRNLDKKLLKIEEVPNDEYSTFLNHIINHADILLTKYPLTMNFQEGFSFFRALGIQDIKEFVNIMKVLSKKYPEFTNLSSSRTGHPADLFTIKQIFINQIEFMPSGAWSVK